MTRIDWELVTRYLAGSCTPSEREWIERMSAAHPELAHAVAAVRDVARDADAAVPEEQLAAALAAVKRDGASVTREKNRVTPRFTLPARRRSLLGIAAGIATIVVGGGAAAWLALHQPARPAAAERPQFSVISAAPGQRLALRLSDGTLVSLAPGSTLRTPADYGRRDRAVELEGEAVFTVTHDSTRPFAVRTPRAVATDLGTRFAVRGYADDSHTDVVVAEGKVAVRRALSDETSVSVDSVILGRGERARVTASGDVQLSRSVALEDYFGWTEGKLVFRRVPLHEAAKRLARWYDVDIRLQPDSIGDRRIVASVEQESATDVLQTIAASLELRLSRAGRVFTLSSN